MAAPVVRKHFLMNPRGPLFGNFALLRPLLCSLGASGVLPAITGLFLPCGAEGTSDRASSRFPCFCFTHLQPWVSYLPWKGLEGFEIPQGYASLGCLGTEVPFAKQILPLSDSQLLEKQVYEW